MWYDLLSLLSIVISQKRSVNDTDSQCLTAIVGKIAPLSQFLQIKINSSLNSHAGGVRFCLRWRNGRCATIRNILSLPYFLTFSAFCASRSPVFILKKWRDCKSLLICENGSSKMILLVSKKILCEKNFPLYSDLKNICKNKFHDNKEKSCS